MWKEAGPDTGPIGDDAVERGSALNVLPDGSPMMRLAPEHLWTPPARRRPDFSRLLRAVGAASVAMALFAAPVVSAAAETTRRPNIVIILGDDLGFADMGSFGGEIRTPNLDSLAREGVRYTNFYTHATCSPTRSILLTPMSYSLHGQRARGPRSAWP